MDKEQMQEVKSMIGELQEAKSGLFAVISLMENLPESTTMLDLWGAVAVSAERKIVDRMNYVENRLYDILNREVEQDG